MTVKLATEAAVRRPKGTGRQYAYEVLRQSILTLAYAPGEVLEEANLVEQIGVSRTLVREAMISLSAEGLIELLPNRGARVARLDLNDVRAFHEGLELIQRAVNRWAAVRNQPQHHGEIRRERLAFEHAAARRDADEMIESNRRFHLAFGEACGNPLIAGSYAQLLTLGLRLSRFLVSYEVGPNAPLSAHLDRIIAQHRQMEEAVLAGDAEAAERLGAAHAQLSLDRSLAALRNNLGSTVTLPAVS